MTSAKTCDAAEASAATIRILPTQTGVNYIDASLRTCAPSIGSMIGR